MKRLIYRIGTLGYWLNPILTGVVAVASVPAMLASSASHPLREMPAYPGYGRLGMALLLVILAMFISVLIITLLFNSWPWLARCHKRRIAAQVVFGIGCVGMVGYTYINLFWPVIAGEFDLLKQVRGIKIWLIVQLLAYNFLFMFIPFKLIIGRRESPRREYLTHLTVKDGNGGDIRLSLETDVAYCYTGREGRHVYTIHPDRPVYECGTSQRELEHLVDPGLYFVINRNFLVHRSAITDWGPEPGGRRIMVWLNPRAPGCTTKTGKEINLWISRERAAAFREWIESVPVGG